MKRLFALFIILGLCSAALWSQERPKVGLVLSGGGAKGFSHVGVLSVIEELGIPIDYIGGTSIGGIIGGLYAIGYDAESLRQLIVENDWSHTLSDNVDREHIPFFEKQEMDRYQLSLPVKGWKLEFPNSLIKGQNIMNRFTQLTYGYHGVSDFSTLPTPFLCVATDIETGEEVVLDKGYLPQCMEATMAVPGVFMPPVIDGKLLVDGGMINNFPVDRVKAMTNDRMIIIGVDLSSGLKNKDDLTSIGEVMNQMISVMGLTKYKENKEQCDVYINPNLEGFGGGSFTNEAAEEMYQRGIEAARSVMGQLVEIRDLLGVTAPKKHSIPFPKTDTLLYLRQVVWEGDVEGDHEYLEGKLDLKEGSYITLDDIQRGIDNIYGTLNYDLVTYKVTGGNEKTLFLHLKESVLNTFNLGAHYDNVNHAGMLINTTIRKGAGSGARLSANLKLSSQPGFDIGYTIDRGVNLGFQTMAEAKTANFTILESSNEYVVEMDYFSALVGTHAIINDRLTLGLNIGYQFSNVDRVLSNNDDWEVPELKPERGIRYTAFLKFDSFDNIYYPKKGFNLDASVKVFTDNFVQYESHVPLLYFKLEYQKAISLTPKFVLLPSVYARGVLWDQEIPYFFKTHMGGTDHTDYLDVQIPFYGMQYMSFPTNNTAVVRLNTRYQVVNKHYVGLVLNGAVHAEELGLDVNPGYIYGGGLRYSYDSFIGPIDAYFTLSNKQSSLLGFLSVGYWF